MNFKSADDIEPSSWSEKELRLVNHVELFQCKPAILKKARKPILCFTKRPGKRNNPTLYKPAKKFRLT